jgi:hypothetical protein
VCVSSAVQSVTSPSNKIHREVSRAKNFSAINVCFFVEYLPEDGLKGPKHVGLGYVRILLYLNTMRL